MGVPDIYSVTVRGANNLRAAIEAEERASRLWMSKWGWIIDEYAKIYEELAQLKKGRKYSEKVIVEEDTRTMLPFPETEGHVYGFLASKPEFRLEIISSPGLSPILKKLSPDMLYRLVDEKIAEKEKNVKSF